MNPADSHRQKMDLDHWGRYRAELHNFILKRIRNPAIADDLVQDVFVKALTQKHRLKSPGKLRAWLFRITRNTIADHYRSRKPLMEDPDRPAADWALEDVESEQELALCLRPLMDHLPQLYREAVRLADLEGVSQREVADRLGLSLSGAKSRVQRGRKHLLDVLLKCCRVELDLRGGLVNYDLPEDCRAC